MTTKSLDQGHLQSWSQDPNKTYQQLYKEQVELNAQTDAVTQVLLEVKEGLANLEERNLEIENKIEKLKKDAIKSDGSLINSKSLSIALFGCSFAAAIIIYCYNPSFK